MQQIAGRSGRSKDAQILIQTSQADFFKPYLKDYEDFIIEELEFREDFYPPFKNLARVLIAHKDYQKGNEITQKTADILKRIEDIEVIGYGAAPIERIANKWRFNILLRSDKKASLLKALHSIKSRDVEIDMDPTEFS